MKNKTDENKIVRYAKKLKAIDYLGGFCKKCKENNFFKLTFHHRNPNEKEFDYNDYNDRRWSILKSELDKCDLLCQNCHRELHYILDKNEKRRISKSIYLEYSGSSCIKCGYNKCPAALSFHHRDPNEKEFWIGGLNERINSIDELNDKIKKEIDKCDLLCSNCHVLEHSDFLFFNNNKKDIEDRMKKYKESQPKIDRDKVYEMYELGNKQKDIAIYFNASKGTISDIIKKRRVN